MDLKKNYQNKQGLTHVVTKNEGGLKKAVFDLLKIEAGMTYTGDTQVCESAFVILSGICSFSGKDNCKAE